MWYLFTPKNKSEDWRREEHKVRKTEGGGGGRRGGGNLHRVRSFEVLAFPD